MKWILNIICFSTLSMFGQQIIESTLIDSTAIEVNVLLEADHFGTQFYIKNNTLYKETPHKTINYNNIQLGNITSVNTFNPLKINVFYKDFNTVIVLDNRLAEIFKIDFNLTQPYKNVSFIGTGFDNTLWIFNQDSQQLELYNYQTNTVKATSIPIQSEVLDLKSNYNYCFILTKNFLYKYNYSGSLLHKIPNNGFTSISENNENVILKKENTLYFLPKNEETLYKINLPHLLINQFLLTNQTLYIYNDESLYQFQLKIK